MFEEHKRYSMWYGNECWFQFGAKSGLKRFEEFPYLDKTDTAIALRALKFRLEEEFGFEISDSLFVDLFKKVCNFNPKPAFGSLAGWEFVKPLQRILESHGVTTCDHQAVWRTFRVMLGTGRHYARLVLNVPHASTAFPAGCRHTFADLDEEERLLVDYYTDELFVPEQPNDKVTALIFPYCRLYCDVERLVNDPLESKGLGISYSREVPVKGDRYAHTWRWFSNIGEAFDLYVDYHAQATKQLVEHYGSIPLLIDCHSFSARPTLLNPEPADIDICIGYNDDDTRPSKVVIGNIEQHFLSRGYSVGLNKPFSCSKTFDVPSAYHSIMIEVNKRLYMDEDTLEKSEGFEKLRNDIQSTYELLLEQK